jgi:glycosyltransferase involved in cell wall biosynthesis
VIPVYNGSNYLRTAVDSALAQTYDNIEVIVVNDGSTDNGATRAVARSYGDRIKYYEKANGHVASAMNFGIRHMSGEHFSWLSHDDMYKPDKIGFQMRALLELGEGTLVYSDFEILDVSTGSITPALMKPVNPEHFRYNLILDNSMHGCTLLIPKSCLVRSGPFDETLRTTQDYDMWFRLARCCRFVYVPGIVVTSRHHPEQGTIALRDVAHPECEHLLSKFVRELDPDELETATGMELGRAYVSVAINLARRGFSAAAKTTLALAQSKLVDRPVYQRLWFRAEQFYRFWFLRGAMVLRRKIGGVTRRMRSIWQGAH